MSLDMPPPQYHHQQGQSQSSGPPESPAIDPHDPTPYTYQQHQQQPTPSPGQPAPTWSTLPGLNTTFELSTSFGHGPYTPLNSSQSDAGVQHTSLSPLVASWSTSPPLHASEPSRPGGPVRNWSASAYPRKRSSGMSMSPPPMATYSSPHHIQPSPNYPPYTHHQTPQPQPTSSPYSAHVYPFSTSASMSAISPPPFGLAQDRRMSSPVGNPSSGLYTFQPSYTPQGYHQLPHGQKLHPAPPGMAMTYPDLASDANKPPRFRPTKEQLAILIGSYNKNKNPDTAEREALARRLGPDVRSKTLQIWFQNRRSKARAKERESAAASASRISFSGSEIDVGASRGGFDPFVVEGSGRKGSLTDVESLRAMVHDDDPALQIIPISVLAISTWTRFLTPGMTATPDLCLALRLPSPAPAIFIFVAHLAETYRITIPLDAPTPTSAHSSFDFSPTHAETASRNPISLIEAAANPTLNAEAVLLRFELGQGACSFSSWNTTSGSWVETGDFSGGVVAGGGKVEVTGQRDTLLPAFGQVHQYLYDAPLLTPVTFTNHQTSPPPSPYTPTPIASTATSTFLPLRVEPVTNSSHTAFASTWRFPPPTSATSANNTPIDPLAPPGSDVTAIRVRVGAMGHAKQRSLSAPMAMPAEYVAGRNDLEMGGDATAERSGGPEYVWPSSQTYGQAPTDQPLRYQLQSHSTPVDAHLYRTAWPFEPPASLGTVGQLINPAHTAPTPSAGAYLNGTTRPIPIASARPIMHNRAPSYGSDVRGERGDSVGLSLRSGASSSGSIMLAAEAQASPPFVFDAMMGLGIGYDAQGSGVEGGHDGSRMGGIKMEVLEEG